LSQYWTVSHVSALTVGNVVTAWFGLAAQWHFALGVALLNLGVTFTLRRETHRVGPIF
jgi:hypothetical protein